MITGFNTDIEHDGVVYHVQTEDKGLETPIILSLVYAGGAILASKRSPYEDLIAEGFNDEALAERLKRQHRLICAAIHGGRINDLKRMGREAATPILVDESPSTLLETPEVTPVDEFVRTFEEFQTTIPQQVPVAPPTFVAPPTPSIEESQPEVQGGSLSSDSEGLVLTLLSDLEFRSGDAPTLEVLVSDRTPQGDKPLANVAVSIKILGTTFRPLIYSLKTQRDGVAAVSTEIPHFTSGRAAVLVRAVAKGKAAELRRVIHPHK